MWTKQRLQQLIATNPIMLERSILKIFSNQTSDEQQYQDTKEHNRIGFSSVDAPILSSFAQQIIKQSHIPEGHRLSPKQKALAIKKMQKYANQLLMFCKQD